MILEARELNKKAEESEQKPDPVEESPFVTLRRINRPPPRTTEKVIIDVVPILNKNTGEIVHPTVHKDPELSIYKPETTTITPLPAETTVNSIPSTENPIISPTLIPSTLPKATVKQPSFFNWEINPESVTKSAFHRAAVSSSNPICTQIAKKIMWLRGNAIDAAVAGAACLGALEITRNGPGGGAIMLIHSIRNETTTVINGIEAAPQAATENFYRTEEKRISGLPI
ncbi:hypothetical protein WR25_17333 [Diploscapter pachys]|uniref:Gamma-glutamyltransferase n=1 Tax=Diploscapter pachys TaxID=2018661 RepID=A0A2A2JN58_9BILA|nr:hypothetical protein WR25_17333 [Diploscapter pachys]